MPDFQKYLDEIEAETQETVDDEAVAATLAASSWETMFAAAGGVEFTRAGTYK
jgi:CHASE3 domain sensor protein